MRAMGDGCRDEDLFRSSTPFAASLRPAPLGPLVFVALVESMFGSPSAGLLRTDCGSLRCVPPDHQVARL